MTKLTHILAADIGGTKIRFGLFDSNMKQCYQPFDLINNASQGREHVLSCLHQGIKQLLDYGALHNLQIDRVGISTAGVIDSKLGLVVDATNAIPQWRGTHLREEIVNHYGLPCWVQNDVNAALLGELYNQPHIPDGKIAMLTLGTGLGGAMADNKQVYAGKNSVAGHFGRMPTPSPWVVGEMVTLEQLVSGTGLVNIANRMAGAAHYQNGQQIIADAKAKQPTALKTLEQFSFYLAMVIEQLYWSIDTDLIIIGGGLIEAKEIWWDLFATHLKNKHIPTEVVPAVLNNDAGMVGAAHFALMQQEYANV